MKEIKTTIIYGLGLVSIIFKSLLSSFMQIVWGLVGIFILKNQIDITKISNPELFNYIINFILQEWTSIVIILSIFFFISNIRELKLKFAKGRVSE